MTITQNAVVSVKYKLTVSDDNFQTEDLVEETSPESPFTFLFGSGGLLEEFEGNLKGLNVGSPFDFKITAANGYGHASQENVVRIPIEAFVAPGEELDTEMVAEGNFLPMVDDQGNHMQGLVVEVGADFIVMDFNHPLADKDLHFSGEVLDVREASAEELAHGHAHGPGGHNH
jgi:FKBP-type peptidyl-prolyl cis-trans isomerase SlyD